MGIVQDRKDIKLYWTQTSFKDRDKHHSWSEIAKDNEGGIIFSMYYDNDTRMVHLKDIKDDVVYDVPYSAKAKGYVLAYKLYLCKFRP